MSISFRGSIFSRVCSYPSLSVTMAYVLLLIDSCHGEEVIRFFFICSFERFLDQMACQISFKNILMSFTIVSLQLTEIQYLQIIGSSRRRCIPQVVEWYPRHI